MSFYSINQRHYSVMSSLEEECRLPLNTNRFYDLSYLSVIEIKGDKAADFLQGQLTCDVRHVTENSMRKGIFCNLKGRIDALVDVINWQGYKLVLPLDLADKLLGILAKTAIVSRVKPELDTSVNIFGLYRGNQDEPLPVPLNLPNEPFTATMAEGIYCYSLGNNRYIILMSDNASASIGDCAFGSLAWHHLQVSQGGVEIYPNTQAIFMPHRLELHKKNYISFDKGCYKGQEIIARTQYRGKEKHALQKILITNKEPLAAGKKLFDPASGLEVGEIIDFCPFSGDSSLMIASLLIGHPDTILVEGHKATTSISQQQLF